MDKMVALSMQMQRGYRLPILLVGIIALMGVMLIAVANDNQALSHQVTAERNKMSVFVVPGARPGEYLPSNAEMLAENFAEYIIQNLNSYTYMNLYDQYKDAQAYFTPSLLVLADAYYAERIKAAQQDEQSSLFVIDRDTVKVKPLGQVDNVGNAEYKVTMSGTRKSILGGVAVADVPLAVTMIVSRTFVSRTNPWGFRVIRYEENQGQSHDITPKPTPTTPATGGSN